LLALSSKDQKSKNNNKNHPTDVQRLTGSLHIREPLHKCRIRSQLELSCK
jgi:hypothetical protein